MKTMMTLSEIVSHVSFTRLNICVKSNFTFSNLDLDRFVYCVCSYWIEYCCIKVHVCICARYKLIQCFGNDLPIRSLEQIQFGRYKMKCIFLNDLAELAIIQITGNTIYKVRQSIAVCKLRLCDFGVMRGTYYYQSPSYARKCRSYER